MAKKSRRSVYDPSLDPLDTAPTANDEDEYYYDDPLSPHSVDMNDDEGQNTDEILDANLHKTSGRNACRRRFLWSLVCMGILAFIITISLYETRKNKRQNNSSGTSSPNTSSPNKSSSSSAALAKPPDSIASVCTTSYMKSYTDTNCNNACAAAQCCDYPTTLDLSCLKGNEETCLSYHASCVILTLPNHTDSKPTGKIKIPKTPRDFEKVCSANSLNSPASLLKCATICERAKCCYETGVSSCLATQPKCKKYATCLNLAAHDSVHPAIAAEVSTKCSLAAVAVNTTLVQCQAVCDVARCCFTGKAPDCTFKKDVQGFCKQYEPCTNLPGYILPGEAPTPTFSPTLFPTIIPTTSGLLDSIAPSVMPSYSIAPSVLPTYSLGPT